MVSYFKQNWKRGMGVYDTKKIISESYGRLPRDEEARRGNILKIKRDSVGGLIVIYAIVDQGGERGD